MIKVREYLEVTIPIAELVTKYQELAGEAKGNSAYVMYGDNQRMMLPLTAAVVIKYKKVQR